MLPFVYLDHAAATPVRPELLANHAALCARYVANPHGTTRQAEVCRRAVAEAEKRLLDALGIDRREARVVWTSGGTEADNLACFGPRSAACRVDAGTHAAMLEPCRQLPACREIPLAGDGSLRLDETDWAGAGLVAVCQVNNETGAVHDLAALRAALTACRSRALLAVDSVQALGKVPIPWREARLDLVALSARKIGGPSGVGALIVRNGVVLHPLLFGGGQQNGIRPGTVDVVGVSEFAQAAELAVAEQAEHSARCQSLAALARESLAGLPVRFLSPPGGVPHIFAFSLPGYEGAVLMRLLAERDVVVGAGSACHAEAAETSHVLRAMGCDEATARGQLRLSFGPDSRPGDVERFARVLRDILPTY
ncbi:MAG: aminotransferase class V-fold PLP-dependent enzyme [Lentisphaeria bacterium]|jgi:cysteine desulfurase|nr:aminotransferase class V-fold PLP-dependent enzyme [Lentisphaeria bacterium]